MGFKPQASNPQQFPTQSNLPRIARRLLDVGVGVVVFDEALFAGVEVEDASGAERDFTQIDQCAGAVSVGFIQRKGFALFHCLNKVGDLRFGIRQGGKLWVDTTLLQISYWDPGARAWINIGSTGPVGPGATVAVGSTTTGAAGTNATVVNSGTASAAVLDFTIPRGADGVPGPAGAPGPQGPPGPPGSGANIAFAANPPITVTETGTSPKTVTYGFNIATLATIP